MKTTEDLRDLLFKELENLTKGKVSKEDINKARTISDIAGQIVYSTRVEIENKKLELELGKADDNVKKWMDRDFSAIQNIKIKG